jgi:hypothetical protein
MNEPKSQTPLTDDKCLGRLLSQVDANFARSLELKLQESERQRDEAMKSLSQAVDDGAMAEVFKARMQTERDQLIKVVDDLANWTIELVDACDGNAVMWRGENVVIAAFARKLEDQLGASRMETFKLREAMKEILGRCQITGMSFESQMHCNTETARKALINIRQPDAPASPSNGKS